MPDVRTFCRVCEPACGLVAHVEDGRLASVRPDREHPISKGWFSTLWNHELCMKRSRLLIRRRRLAGACGIGTAGNLKHGDRSRNHLFMHPDDLAVG